MAPQGSKKAFLETDLVHKRQIQKYLHSRDKQKRIFVLAAFILDFGTRAAFTPSKSFNVYGLSPDNCQVGQCRQNRAGNFNPKPSELQGATCLLFRAR
ncbi:MAG: hypothetical protein KA740_03600 [Rhodoferax sp.]|jgi:hypothetical protein|nr:hypothetical protein [Rhodoferax sp.]